MRGEGSERTARKVELESRDSSLGLKAAKTYADKSVFL
jgi:hypothetical protein